MGRNLILLICMSLLFTGCGASRYATYTPSTGEEFKVQEPYKLDLSSIKIPDKPNPTFVVVDNNTYKEVDPNKATHVMFDQKEYAKIGSVVVIAGSYKKIMLQQEELINIEIKKNNTLKEYLELQRMTTDQYGKLWETANNSLIDEKKDHKIDNAINKAVMIVITVLFASTM